MKRSGIPMMMLLLLGLTGCGDDTGSTGGDGGSGGTAGTGGTGGSAAAGGTGGSSGTGGVGAGGGGGGGGGGSGGQPTGEACENSMDLEIIDDPTFTETLGDCATEALGNPAQVATCLQDDAGLSEACSECYGTFTGCLLNNCLVPCRADPMSTDCIDCLLDNCNAQFEECSGFPARR